MQDLIKYMRELVVPFYKENDKGHQIDHADNVCNLALELNVELGLNIEKHLIIIAAYCHDIFAKYRDEHHLIAHDFLLGWNFELPGINEEELNLVAKACLEHRGSYAGKFTSNLSELISSADRGRPSDFELEVTRAYNYGCCKLGLTHDESCVGTVERMLKRKARMPDMYLEYFSEELTLREALDATLTPELVNSIVSK